MASGGYLLKVSQPSSDARFEKRPQLVFDRGTSQCRLISRASPYWKGQPARLPVAWPAHRWHRGWDLLVWSSVKAAKAECKASTLALSTRKGKRHCRLGKRITHWATGEFQATCGDLPQAVPWFRDVQRSGAPVSIAAC